MTWSKQVKNLANILIRDNFPELSKERIIVLSSSLGPFWGVSWWPLPFFRLIMVSHKSKDVTQDALIGLLAHELCHHVIYKNDGWVKYIVRTPLIYTMFRKRIRAEECRVDRMVMDRGFGKHLYLLTKIIDNDPSHSNVKKYYYTPTEIEDYCLKNSVKF
ncbi:MAG: hypothetical protein WCJ57_00690 [Candidatus Falkowbacteria bacterium]